MVTIRELQQADAQIISEAFLAQGWNKSAAQYEQYWRETQDGTRTVLVAEKNGRFAGYVTIMWRSDYPPFQEQDIPEVVDFNMLQAFQRQGIGTALMDKAEQLISEQSPLAGIGVGLTSDYGAAQALYTKRGYICDGRGTFAHGRWIPSGTQVTLDDYHAIYLTKSLWFDEQKE